MDPDAPLVARARRGDHLAFGQLVRRHQSGVYRAACAVLGSAADADDVVQDTWMHAYTRLAQFHETATFKTWIHAIVRHCAIDHHRRSRRHRRYGDRPVALLPPCAELRADGRSPEDLLLEAEREARLARAIAGLPDRLRLTLELWHTGQYSYQELARAAGVRMGTIKSRVWEARRQVAKQTRDSAEARRTVSRPCRGATTRPSC